MFNNDNTTILFILCIIFLVGFIYISTTENMTLMQSTIDGELYKVRDLPDKQLAANMLATIKLNIQVIVNYLYTNKTKYPKYTKYINYLLDNYKYITIRENSTNSSTTSYSINKQNLVFCLRSKELHDNSIGRSSSELLRKLKAAQFVRMHGGEVCPANWEPGKQTLKPGLNLVGKI